MSLSSGESAIFEIVDSMLLIPVVASERGRDQLVGTLRTEIAGAIPRSSDAMPDLLAITHTCLNYQGGFNELFTALKGLAGDSLAVRQLDEIVARMLPMPPPAQMPGELRQPGRASRSLVSLASAMLPTRHQDRYQEEWLSLLSELPTRRDRARHLLSLTIGIPKQSLTLHRPITGVGPAGVERGRMPAAVTAWGTTARWRMFAALVVVILLGFLVGALLPTEWVPSR